MIISLVKREVSNLVKVRDLKIEVKAFILTLIMLSLVFITLTISYAKVKAFKASVAIQGLSAPVDALIIKNRTYVALDDLEKLLGFKVWWSYDEQLLYVGKVGVDVAPIIIKGKTYVPIRPVAKASGYTLSWDQRTRTVTLVKINTSKYQGYSHSAKLRTLEVSSSTLSSKSKTTREETVEQRVEELIEKKTSKTKTKTKPRTDESFTLPPVSPKTGPNITFGKGKAYREVFMPRYAKNSEFLVTVTEVKETDTVKSFYHPAKGNKFVVVFVSQQNISNKIQIYTGRFYLVDDQGNRYDYIEGLSNYWLQVLIPNGINFGSLVFEIPKDRYPAKLVLETYGSPPLVVNLL